MEGPTRDVCAVLRPLPFLSDRNPAPSELWCERGDSNPHPLRDQILSLARLPIPPLSHIAIIPEENSGSPGVAVELALCGEFVATKVRTEIPLQPMQAR